MLEFQRHSTNPRAKYRPLLGPGPPLLSSVSVDTIPRNEREARITRIDDGLNDHGRYLSADAASRLLYDTSSGRTAQDECMAASHCHRFRRLPGLFADFTECQIWLN